MNLAKYVDHTILKADATDKDIERLCDEARDCEFASVCINPGNVKAAARLLKGSKVKVCTVIGFPLGANATVAKVFETTDAIKNGAQEVDMVINIGAMKSGDYDRVFEDIKAVVDAAKDSALVKVIIETCLLTDEEKEKVCKLCVKAGADFVKTSTGFSTGGATVEDVALMKKAVGGKAKVKASGGVRTKEAAEQMIEAGADRIGTSNGVAFVK